MTEKTEDTDMPTAAYALDYKGKSIFMDGNGEDILRDKTKLTAKDPDEIDDVVEIKEKVELVRRQDAEQQLEKAKERERRRILKLIEKKLGPEISKKSHDTLWALREELRGELE